jgi:energy-converting hydrogenase Eha subunit F
MFVHPINEIYTLTVTSKGQTYTATETLKPVALIDEIIQNDKGGLLETTLKSKLILMIQLTSSIICTTTVILIKFYKFLCR